MNTRQQIRNDDVKVIQVPYFEGLTMQTMLQYASAHPKVLKCLPSLEREINKLPRGYVANIIYTIVGDEFKQWVNKQIKMRNDKFREEKNIVIEMDPEVAAIFRAS